MTAGGEVFVARTDYFSCFGRLYFFAPDCPAPLSGKQAGITGELLFMFETITTFAFNPHYNKATGFGPSGPGLAFSSIADGSQIIYDHKFCDSVADLLVNLGQFW